MTELYIILALCIVILGLLAVVGALVILLIRGDNAAPEQQHSRWKKTVYAGQRDAYSEQKMAQWQLELLNLQSGQRYRIVLDRPIVIGRSIPNYHTFNDVGIGQSTAISKRQCRMFETNGQIYLQNLSQVNCTRLNEQLLERPTALHLGDMIQVADVLLRVNMMYCMPV